MTDSADSMPQQHPTRPNFVIVMTDDQGPWALPHLTPELQMPELLAMTAESMVFDRAYCPSPVCSPARASILTGRTPSTHGVHDWLIGTRHPEALPDHYLAGQPTLPEILAGAGYRCGHSGKWHVGDASVAAPGFDFWFAHRYGGGNYYNAPIWRDGVEAEQPGYLSHAITDQAVRFIEQQTAEQPFYLQVHYTAPHTPWIDSHPAEVVARYDGCTFDSIPIEEPHPWMRPRQDEYASAIANREAHLAGYFASLTVVDQGLGQLRQALTAAGLSENTIVIFMGDNGFSCGHHGIWGKGNGTWPLNFWDNSVRVPLIVHVPGGASGHCDRLTSTRELLESVCEYADVPAPPDRWRSPGSFAGATLAAASADSPECAVVLAEYGDGRMITDGRWVRVVRPQGPNELYDHDGDPQERHNLTDEVSVAAQRKRLDDLLSDWFATYSRPDTDGRTQAVTGLGQIHPISRGRSLSQTYQEFSPQVQELIAQAKPTHDS